MRELIGICEHPKSYIKLNAYYDSEFMTVEFELMNKHFIINMMDEVEDCEVWRHKNKIENVIDRETAIRIIRRKTRAFEQYKGTEAV